MRSAHPEQAPRINTQGVRLQPGFRPRRYPANLNPIQDANPTVPRHLPIVILAALLCAPVSSLAEAWAATISAALTRADPGARADALRRQGSAVRGQADSLVANDPALRVKHLGDRLTEDTGYTEWEAMLDLPLWLPGQRAARRALAESLGLRADALDRFLRWEIAGRVREAAWAEALAQGRLRQAERALADTRALEGQVARRVTAGDLARVDLLLAQQETLTQEVALQAAQAEFDAARQRFSLLTERKDLPAPLEERVAAVTELPPDHPGLAAAEAEVAQTRAERDRVGTERRGNPTLSLGGKRTQDNRDTNPYTALSLELSIPFGLSRQAAPRLAEAEVGYTEKVAERARLHRELDTEIKLADTTQRSAKAALATAQRQQALAAETLALVQRGFDLGELDLAALLRERTKAQEAALNLEVRRLELGQAGSRLNQALGVVPQ
jgi:outer membrane protein, heavy metal efflux system